MNRRIDRPGNLPLLEWGETLRRSREKRLRLQKRAAILAAGILMLGATMLVPPTPRLVWNASASAPIGLYAVTPDAFTESGDMVIARLPVHVRKLASERRYLPYNVPLVKRVAASTSDLVCARGPDIFINGKWAVERRARDGNMRPMPWWTRCHFLRRGERFLLMDAPPSSFDGRYFGITKGSDIVGRARPMWTR